MKSIIWFFILSASLFFFSCEKEIINPFKQHYKITGNFFYDQNFKPLEKIDLILYFENSTNDKRKILDKFQTTETGFFEFYYPHIKEEKKGRLFIAQNPNGIPTFYNYGTIWDSIIQNIDIDRDIPYKPFANLTLRLKNKRNLKPGDSLLISGIPIRVEEGIKYQKINEFGEEAIIFIYPFGFNKFGPMVVNYSGRYSKPDFHKLSWGIGKKEFLLSKESDKYNKQPYVVYEYPASNEVKLKIK